MESSLQPPILLLQNQKILGARMCCMEKAAVAWSLSSRWIPQGSDETSTRGRKAWGCGTSTPRIRHEQEVLTP